MFKFLTSNLRIQEIPLTESKIVQKKIKRSFETFEEYKFRLTHGIILLGDNNSQCTEIKKPEEEKIE